MKNNLSIQQIKNKIEVNNILIDIYKDVECVNYKVVQMQLENIELRLILNSSSQTDVKKHI